MGYRRRDRSAQGGFPLIGLGAKLGMSLGKKVLAKVTKKGFAKKAAKGATGLALLAAPMPGGSVAKRAVRGVKAAAAGEPRKYRRMNAGNAKAARRAIRRIKAVRGLLQSIERQLPKRKAATPRRKGKVC